jgi:hypothetical protein
LIIELEKAYSKFQGSKQDEKYRYYINEERLFDFKKMVLVRSIDAKIFNFQRTKSNKIITRNYLNSTLD